jgi:hypothetical protein
MLNQQLSKNPDLSRGVVSRWPDNEEASFRERMIFHQRYQSAGRELLLRQEIRQRGYAQPGDGCRGESHTVVRLEATLRTHCDHLVSVNEVPRLGALHETLMREELVGRFGSTMFPDIFRAGDKCSVDRPDAPCDQVRIAEVTAFIRNTRRPGSSTAISWRTTFRIWMRRL